MNAHGSTPVLVLNPIHPTVLAELRKFGWDERKAAALASLRDLRERPRFVVVDARTSALAGHPDRLDERQHVNRLNMRRLLTYIVAHSYGALR